MSQNRLGGETSPYLLQHRHNPVHWWPWGEEALEEAQRTGKPILLSVGYAACHWCHVMAHESFEDDETAQVMNELFVNIKVDREERPDIDTIYMTALHSLGEQGGWPLTMFLTPQAEPFWGGTYFPKEPKFGRVGFKQVLNEVARVYREEPDKVRHNATLIVERLRPRGESAAGDLTEELVAEAAQRLVTIVDPVHGGIQGAPKFPQASLLAFLWRAGLRYGLSPCLEAVDNTLAHICQGGIYDHLGGGFARYTVDAHWLVPHFEKMLYDNAQLVDLMTELWRERRTPLYADRIAETVGWLLREMVAEGGGFAASFDADSEGEEGKFYVWSKDEIEDVLGPDDAALFARVYDVTGEGNWEGHVILNRLGSLDLLSDGEEERLAAMRAKLLERRAKRVRPGWDDKVLADWNGLMIAALAKAAQTFYRQDWLEAALRAYRFVRDTMGSEDGRLIHARRAGEGRAPAIATDYANMIAAALRLYQATGDDPYLDDAERWTGILDEHYWSEDLGGYFLTADDTADVIVRTRAAHDDATPNANATMLSNLVALWLLTGDNAHQARAEATLRAFLADVARNLVAHTGMLSGSLDVLAPRQVVIVAPQGEASAESLTNALSTASLPGAIVQIVRDANAIPTGSPAAGKTARGGKATAYVCVGTTCAPPATSAKTLLKTIRERRQNAAIAADANAMTST